MDFGPVALWQSMGLFAKGVCIILLVLSVYSLFISVDHAGGIRTSYSWVSAVSVKKGQAVRAGDVIGKTGQGHPGSDRTHLHFSARLDGTYIDPMLLLGGGNLDDVIHLAAF